MAVAWDEPFSSYNSNTVFGDAATNHNIRYATNSQFNYFDGTPELQKDPSFGSYEKISDDPLVVKYTIADGVTWSDGTAVDAADLLLNWASLSGALNTPGFEPTRSADPTTGELAPEIPGDVVYFDSGFEPTAGLRLVSALPTVSDDRKSITMTWDSPSADWELAFSDAGLPAHVLAAKSLGIEDPQRAKDAVISAILTDNAASLEKLATFWNTGFNFTEMPSDRSLVVSNGPYRITDLVPNQYVTLTANENYGGAHKPKFATVTVRFIADPMAAIQALQTGEVQVIAPPATAGVAELLATLDMEVLEGFTSAYEHIDLQFDQSRSGHFNNPLIREAFLKVVPRQEIVENLIEPIQGSATTRDSLVFLPGAEGYDDSIAANGSEDFAGIDVAGATALLAEAGVTNPEVCVLFSSTNAVRVAAFQLIQQSAALAGFAVTDCSTPDMAAVLGTPGAYDAALFGWRSTGPGVTGSELAAFTSDGSNNLSYYSNARVDRIADNLLTESDPLERIEQGKRLDKILLDDFYGVTIFQYPSVTAFDPAEVANVSSSALPPTVFWNIWEWSPASD